jgi:hypothetical protein
VISEAAVSVETVTAFHDDDLGAASFEHIRLTNARFP